MITAVDPGQMGALTDPILNLQAPASAYRDHFLPSFPFVFLAFTSPPSPRRASGVPMRRIACVYEFEGSLGGEK